MADPKVYDVRYAKFVVNGIVMEDVSDDGFGITPTSENSMIMGLTGEQGFNRDPSSGGEATLVLKANSASNAVLRTLFAQQMQGSLGPIKVEIVVDDVEVSTGVFAKDSIGFSNKALNFAFIQKPQPFETDGKESPNIEWNFIGYGFDEE